MAQTQASAKLGNTLSPTSTDRQQLHLPRNAGKSRPRSLRKSLPMSLNFQGEARLGLRTDDVLSSSGAAVVPFACVQHVVVGHYISDEEL